LTGFGGGLSVQTLAAEKKLASFTLRPIQDIFIAEPVKTSHMKAAVKHTDLTEFMLGLQQVWGYQYGQRERLSKRVKLYYS
jgi:hypothetical protein